MSRRDIAIIPHTEKSFVVISTNHILHLVSLKNLGGVFDAHIIDKQTGKKFMGWIFFMNKKEEILKWINEGCPKVYTKVENKLETEENGISDESSLLKEFEKRIQSSIDTIFLKLDCFEVQIKNILEEVNIIKSKIEQEEKSTTKIETEEEYEILDKM